jgi:hypothetical protein
MKTSKNDYAMEIYLFYPNLDKLEKKGNFNYFFKNLNDIDKQLDNCVIFLSLQTAMQYSHFMHTSHVTLKAQVPQIAINGHEHGLTLKKGFLTKKHIEGCFPCGKKGMLYLKNPEFDVASL